MPTIFLIAAALLLCAQLTTLVLCADEERAAAFNVLYKLFDKPGLHSALAATPCMSDVEFLVALNDNVNRKVLFACESSTDSIYGIGGKLLKNTFHVFMYYYYNNIVYYYYFFFLKKKY